MIAYKRDKGLPLTRKKKFVSFRELSHLKSLQAFEATARHSSFVGAAAELGVTPAAVGQMVRSLETWLGSPLFHRQKHGRDRLVPIDSARAALLDLSEGLNRLEAGLEKLRAGQGRTLITISASQAIVAKWLLPELEDFTSQHPKIEVRLDVTDRLADLSRGEADLGVRCGAGAWAGLTAVRLMDEAFIAVASPDLPRLPNESDLKWLERQTLIYDSTPQGAGVFPNWDDWANVARISLPPTQSKLSINASAAVLQATIKGHGIALARRALAAQDLAAGRLRLVFPDVVLSIPWGYYAVTTPRALNRPAVAAFRDWLVNHWQAKPQPPSLTVPTSTPPAPRPGQ